MCECVRAPSRGALSHVRPDRPMGPQRVYVRVHVYGRCGWPCARESRPEVLPSDEYRSRMRGVPSGRSVRGYVIPKVGRSLPSHPMGRVGRSCSVTENVTNLKQDRPKQNTQSERYLHYLSFPYSTSPPFLKLDHGGGAASVGRTSHFSGRGVEVEPFIYVRKTNVIRPQMRFRLANVVRMCGNLGEHVRPGPEYACGAISP